MAKKQQMKPAKQKRYKIGDIRTVKKKNGQEVHMQYLGQKKVDRWKFVSSKKE